MDGRGVLSLFRDSNDWLRVIRATWTYTKELGPWNSVGWTDLNKEIRHRLDYSIFPTWVAWGSVVIAIAPQDEAEEQSRYRLNATAITWCPTWVPVVQWTRLRVQADPLSLGSGCLTHWGRNKMDTDNIVKFNLMDTNVCILFQISLKCVHRDPINNKSALFQIMAWRWTGNKPQSDLAIV